MTIASQQEADRRRVDVLQRLKILDTGEEQIYQDAVSLASWVCGAPISLVSLLDGERQWIKAKMGTDATQTSKEVSFCVHTIQGSETMVVKDATKDSRFVSNPFVTGDFHLRFYAGSPIYADNEPVGALCVLDREPRDISPDQIESLEAIARQVSATLQLRLQNDALALHEAELAQALNRTETLAAKFASEKSFVRAISDAAPGLISYYDSDLRYRFANKAFQDWFGRTPDEFLGLRVQFVLGEQLFAAIEPRLRKALAGERQQFEHSHAEPGGFLRHVFTRYIPDVGPDGSVKGIFVLITDITERKKTELELRLAASLLDSISEGVMVMDANGIIVSVNPAFENITGYSAEDAVGLSPGQLPAESENSHFFREMLEGLDSTGGSEGQDWVQPQNRDAYLVHHTVSVVRDGSGNPQRYVVVFRDVTAQWAQDEQIRHQAHFDALTGLPNRHLLLERLSQLLSQSERESKIVALMFCDLDGFKGVNDTLGHRAGDAVLVAVGGRLQSEVRKSDTVARLGGDEFVILLDNPANVGEVERIAQRILDAMGIPIDMEGQPTQVGISIGIAVSGLSSETAVQLLDRADRALYAAKVAGKNGWRLI